MSQKHELSKLEEQIQALQNRKKLLEQKNKVKKRKILTKQKILVGAYFLNNFDKYLPQDEMLIFVNDVASTISKTRKADIDAIDDLKNKFTGS
jgi:hypothetical protein